MDGWMEITRDYGDHRAITVNAKSESPMRTGLTVIRSKLELMVITNYYRLALIAETTRKYWRWLRSNLRRELYGNRV